MKYTVNSVVEDGIRDLVRIIKDELDMVEKHRKKLKNELAAAETTMEAMRERLPEQARVPVQPPNAVVIREPRISPSRNGHVNGSMETYDGGRTWVQDRLSQNGHSDSPLTPIEDEPLQRRLMRMTHEVDYTGAQVFSDKVRRIAEATEDGVVNTTHMAQILIRDGHSQSTQSNLRGTVGNHFKRDDDYEYIGPGTYQYLPMAQGSE